VEKKTKAEGHISRIVRDIRPAVLVAQLQSGGDLLHRSVAANVDHVVDQISRSRPFLKKAIQDGKLRVVGAVYHLDDGKVSWR
jgi:carbonic anhydrase